MTGHYRAGWTGRTGHDSALHGMTGQVIMGRTRVDRIGWDRPDCDKPWWNRSLLGIRVEQARMG